MGLFINDATLLRIRFLSHHIEKSRKIQDMVGRVNKKFQILDPQLNSNCILISLIHFKYLMEKKTRVRLNFSHFIYWKKPLSGNVLPFTSSKILFERIKNWRPHKFSVKTISGWQSIIYIFYVHLMMGGVHKLRKFFTQIFVLLILLILQ